MRRVAADAAARAIAAGAWGAGQHGARGVRPGLSLCQDRGPALLLSRSPFIVARLTAGRGAGSTARGSSVTCQRTFSNTIRHSKAVTTLVNIPRRPSMMSTSRKATDSMWARMVSQSHAYEAVVVGSGPAGITCVGNLLERKLSPILWVDNEFNGGRVNKMYREVPSNTKVKLFIEFATALAPFRKIVSGMPSRSRWDEPSASDAVGTEKPDKLQQLRVLDQEKGCQLSHAADMCLMLTDGLKKTPGVIMHKGKVSEAVLSNEDTSSPHWTVQLENEDDSLSAFTRVQTKRLVLCTGASPTNPPPPAIVPDMRILDLDTAISPTRLSSVLSPLGPTTISVIGASHSAIIVLMNLCALASSSKPDLRIRWFTRHALRYAEFMDGWILRDNTGLKGEAATWAKQNLEPEVFDKSDVSKYMTAVHYEPGTEKETFEQQLPGTDLIVQAIGYARNRLPALKTASGKDITPYYDHEKGSFTYVKESECGSIGDLAKLPGTFGAGIAFPERVKDPHGNVEYAVGFFKFMKFVKRVVPDWN